MDPDRGGRRRKSAPVYSITPQAPCDGLDRLLADGGALWIGLRRHPFELHEFLRGLPFIKDRTLLLGVLFRLADLELGPRRRIYPVRDRSGSAASRRRLPYFAFLALGCALVFNGRPLRDVGHLFEMDPRPFLAGSPASCSKAMTPIDSKMRSGLYRFWYAFVKRLFIAALVVIVNGAIVNFISSQSEKSFPERHFASLLIRSLSG